MSRSKPTSGGSTSRKRTVRHRRRERVGGGMQGLLSFGNKHGGKRPGSGRKPSGHRAGVGHDRRPEHNHRHPILVTTRLMPIMRHLRGRNELSAFEASLRSIATRSDCSMVHFSIQRNHLHLLIEADNKGAVSSGVGGFLSGLARRLNRLWNRSGKVWSDRYHACPKTRPTEVRHALAYVFRNGVKHGVVTSGKLDRASSISAFYALPEPIVDPPALDLEHLSRPTTWLLRVGWRRSGPITVRDLTTPPRKQTA